MRLLKIDLFKPDKIHKPDTFNLILHLYSSEEEE